eukprot:UN24806
MYDQLNTSIAESNSTWDGLMSPGSESFNYSRSPQEHRYMFKHYRNKSNVSEVSYLSSLSRCGSYVNLNNKMNSTIQSVGSPFHNNNMNEEYRKIDTPDSINATTSLFAQINLFDNSSDEEHEHYTRYSSIDIDDVSEKKVEESTTYESKNENKKGRPKAISIQHTTADMPIFRNLKKGELPKCTGLYTVQITGSFSEEKEILRMCGM